MIADRPDLLTPTWLAQTLPRADRTVSPVRVTATPIGNGQTAMTYRLALTWPDPAAGPASVIVKLPPPDEEKRRSAAFAFQQEIAFYRDVAATVEVDAPRCLHAEISDDGTSFILVLEDLSAAASREPTIGVDAHDARRALTNLAKLHAARWGDPTLGDIGVCDWWGDQADGVGVLQQVATEQFVAYLGGRLAADDAATLREAARRASVFLTRREAPATVIHGDYRLDNLLFTADDGPVYAVDWQTMSLGPGARDLSYFLSMALAPTYRREHESELVAHYHGELVARGVVAYDLEQCRRDYALSQLWGAQLVTIGAFNAHDRESPEAVDMFATMAARASIAIRDHGSLARSR